MFQVHYYITLSFNLFLYCFFSLFFICVCIHIHMYFSKFTVLSQVLNFFSIPYNQFFIFYKNALSIFFLLFIVINILSFPKLLYIQF